MIPREVQVNKSIVISFTTYQNALPVIPSSASVAIYDNKGDELQSGDATIGTSGEISYTFLSANNVSTGSNFKAVFTVDGVERAYLFDVAAYALANEVTDADLFARLETLNTKYKTRSSKTTAEGTVSSIIDTNIIADGKDYTGGYVTLLFDEGVHNARITSYDAATGTMSISPSYTTVVPQGTRYTFRPSFQLSIDTAFDSVRASIRNRVRLASGYIDSRTVKQAVICKALEFICFSNIEQSGDKWETWYNGFKAECESALSEINDAYDTNGDGNVSFEENNDRPSTWSIGAVR